MNTCSDPQFYLEMNYVVERIENRRVFCRMARFFQLRLDLGETRTA